MPFCSNCGAEINDKQVICLKCGCAIPGKNISANKGGIDLSKGGHNKIVAVILAILLGGLGAHKFYLGQVGLGLLYLFFCWTGIPSIIGLIEGIVYLTLSDEQFAAKYH